MTTEKKYPEFFEDLACEICATCASCNDDCNCDYCNSEVCVHSEQMQMLLRLCLEVKNANDDAERMAKVLEREAKKKNLRPAGSFDGEEYTDEEIAAIEANDKAESEAEQSELFQDLAFNVCDSCESCTGECAELNPQTCVHCAQMRELFNLCREVEASRLEAECKAEGLKIYAETNNLRPEDEGENCYSNDPLYTTLEGWREQLRRIRERKAA